MFIDHCLVCNDARHFEVKVHDAERIAAYLERYVKKGTEIEDYQLWSQISMDGQHQHFMCGVCHKVNPYDLKRAEERVKSNVYSICKALESGTSLPVGEILRCLQGYYPILWKCIDKANRRKN